MIVYVLFYAGSMVTVNACHPGVARTDIHRYMPIRSSTVSIIRQILTDDDMLHVYKYLKRVETGTFLQNIRYTTDWTVYLFLMLAAHPFLLPIFLFSLELSYTVSA